MPDNKSEVGRQDRRPINIHEDYEVRAWSKKLGVTSEQLKKAVQQVGDSAEVVRRQLRK